MSAAPISMSQFNHVLSHTFESAGHAAQAAPAQGADAFRAMAQTSRMTPPQPPETDTGAVVSRLARSQDAAFRTVSDDMLYMISNAERMSMPQLTAATLQVQLETAGMQVDLQTKLAVVTSSKDALDTLMKNQ
jgi:type III secretion inner rod protein HrpB2